MNKVNLIGRMTKDPDTRNAGQTTLAKFNLAVDRKYKKEGEASADFINCTAFGKTAENIGRFFNKGSQIAVSGRIQTGSYNNKDGQRVYTTDVIVEEFDFCGSKNSSAGNSDLPSGGDEFMNIPKGIEEDLPFAQPTKPVQQISMDDLPFSRG